MRPGPAPHVTWRAALAGLAGLVLLAATAGCGSDQDPTLIAPATVVPTTAGVTTVCGAPVQEALDGNSLQHLVPGAEPPRYATDPPTSGAHAVGNFPIGVLAAPIERPVQVGMLEGGAILIQHRDLTPADRMRLEGLAVEHVTVAPNPDLPAPVVATAWTWKITCQSVDPDALSAFVAAHAGKGTGTH